MSEPEQRTTEEAASGQSDIFGSIAEAEPERLQLPMNAQWSESEKLHKEFQAIGFYFSAHPLDSYQMVLEKMRVQQYAEFAIGIKRGAEAGRLAGTVASKQIRRTKTGNKMGIITLSDATGQYEVVLFSETLEEFGDQLEVGKSFILTVSVRARENDSVSLQLNTLSTLSEDQGAKEAHLLRVFVRDQKPATSIAKQLKPGGRSPVSLIMIKPDGAGEVEIELKGHYNVSGPVASAIKAIDGVVDVELV